MGDNILLKSWRNVVLYVREDGWWTRCLSDRVLENNLCEKEEEKEEEKSFVVQKENACGIAEGDTRVEMHFKMIVNVF